jgi:membrane associated rhomboid family serine protease
MATAARFGRAQSFGRAAKPVPPPRASAGAAVAAAAPIVEPVPVAVPRIGFGALTLALMAVLTVIFLCELRFSGSGGAAVNDHYFIALGGLGWNFFAGHHEWWRFFTAPWLHADAGHITGNGIALVITGWMLERLIGRAWLLAAFFFGAWGGSIASLALTPASILVSLGASGAIMALVALLFTLSFHAEADRSAKRYRRWAMFLLIPALLPSVPGDGMAIDIGAHFGGAVAGTAFGFLLLIIWPENGARPPFVWAAGAFAALGLLLTGGAFYLAAQSFPVYAADAGQLAPRTLLVDDDKTNRSGELVTLYPHDPLAHMVRALHLNAQHDVTGALGEVRAGLDQTRALDTYYPAALRFHMRVMLVLLLLQDNRSDDARTEAAPICPIIRDPARWPERDGGLKTGIAFVRDNHICD